MLTLGLGVAVCMWGLRVGGGGRRAEGGGSKLSGIVWGRGRGGWRVEGIVFGWRQVDLCISRRMRR